MKMNRIPTESQIKLISSGINRDGVLRAPSLFIGVQPQRKFDENERRYQALWGGVPV